MKIKELKLHPYQRALCPYFSKRFGPYRHGVVVELLDDLGRTAWGEIAPLPGWNQESLEEAIAQLHTKKGVIMSKEYSLSTWASHLQALHLLPSVLFGIESALLALLDPLPSPQVQVSHLLFGSVEEILSQAKKLSKGTVKVKINHLPLSEATSLIDALKERFSLRVDINRGWSTRESLAFFDQFPLGTFEYVEEPFANPEDLVLFPHPLAIDESFPNSFSLKQLEELPTLKAIIYKPTVQGGMLHALPLIEWMRQTRQERKIELVLSCAFETEVALSSLASLGARLQLKSPLGIGTEHVFIP